VLFRDLLAKLARFAPPEPAASPAAPEAAPGPTAANGARPATPSADARLALTDALWGEGFTEPGGAEAVLALAKPLGLSAAHSLLLVGAQTGGPPRALAGTLGAWVSAFEDDPARAAVAARRAAAAGLAKRATVQPWSPAEPRFPERYFQRALALDPMARAAPDALLAAIARALKPAGELVLTAIVAGPAPQPGALAEWMAAEARRVPPPTERALGTALETLGHEVRVAKDITGPHLQAALRQWHEFVQALGPQRPTPERARLIVREAELWLRRGRLMRAGAIRMMRFHAIGRAG